MKKLNFIVPIVSAFMMMLVCATTFTAQETIVEDSTGRTLYLNGYVGGYAGLGINMHSADFGALPGFPSCCSSFGSGFGLAPAIGASFELPLAKKLSFQARLGFTMMSGKLSVNETIGNEPILDDGPIPSQTRQDVVVEHTLDASLPMIVFEPTFGYEVIDNLVVSLGPRVGYLMATSFEQQETLLTPEGYTFLDGTTVRNEASSDIPEAQNIQFHAAAALGYILPLSERMSLVPEARIYIPISKVSNVDWSVQTLQVGVNLRYGLYSAKERIIIRDTVVKRDTTTVQKPGILAEVVSLTNSTTSESTIEDGDYAYITTTINESYLIETPRPFSPGLSAAFVATKEGVQRPATTIRVEELDVIESYPILPQIFYDTLSADLNRSDQVVLTRNRVDQFVPEKLRRDQLDVYKNMLNIIGVRMQQNPAASLTITGTTDNTNSEANNKLLAEQRAEGVKSYLMNVFGIGDERINVEARLLPEQPANPTTEDGMAENRRVEITSDDIAILEPVEFRDKDLIIKPTDFALQPAVSQPQDISEWEAAIVQGNRTLASSKGTGKPSTLPWNATSEGVGPKNEGRIVGTVKVRSEIGQERTAADTLDVDYVTLQLMASRREEGKRIERYSLIVFDFNSAKLNKSNQRVMERIKSRIQPDSKVKIVGFADRQGRPEYNRTLARKRCEEAQRVLGLPDSRVVIEPVGSDRLLYDNDTPEGRSYSRTVQIEVETPLRN